MYGSRRFVEEVARHVSPTKPAPLADRRRFGAKAVLCHARHGVVHEGGLSQWQIVWRVGACVLERGDLWEKGQG